VRWFGVYAQVVTWLAMAGHWLTGRFGMETVAKSDDDQLKGE
jgi:hypothetical protein